MNLFKDLAELYDELIKTDCYPLQILPLGYSTGEFDIEIEINEKSEFINAHQLIKPTPKEQKEGMINPRTTIIPVTEASASRTTNSAPHLLFDSIQYLAKDFDEYKKFLKEEDKEKKSFFEDYINQLKELVKSNNNKYLNIFYKYISNNTLIKDLDNIDFFNKDDNGFFVDSIKGLFIRFTITDSETNASYAFYKDVDFIKLFVNFYLEQNSMGKEIDYITGNLCTPGKTFPKKIRNTGDNAKLFSSNDTSFYTFRGQFKNFEEACVIGKVTSDKAHNTLKFLIKNFSFTINDKVFLIFSNTKNIKELNARSFLTMDTSEDFEDFKERNEDNDIKNALLKDYAFEIKKKFLGIKNDLKLTNNPYIDIVILDAMTTGRLSINYYKEYRGFQINEFLENMEKFMIDTSWYNYFKDKKNNSIVHTYSNPSIINMARSIYGIESDNYIGSSDKKVYDKTITELFKVILNNSHFDSNFVRALTYKTLKPTSFKNLYNWEKVVKIACSVNRKYFNNKFKKEEIPLEMENKSFHVFSCVSKLIV